MIHQELSLAPHLTVMENILLGDEPARGGFIRWPAMRDRARAALLRLGRSDIDPGTLVMDLPLAARQMVEIARALATGARVLVMDEPTSSLGHDDVQRLFAVIADLKSEGHAIVYVSHFLEEVREVADRVVVLRDGRVTATLGASAASSEIVSAMVGREIERVVSPVAQTTRRGGAEGRQSRRAGGQPDRASRRDPGHRRARRLGADAITAIDFWSRGGATRPRDRRGVEWPSRSARASGHAVPAW